MHAADSYDYSVIRIVPRVERGEFVNAGVIVSCESRQFLQARVEVDERRLRALDPTIDIETVRRHLQAIVRICEGAPDAGPIARLPRRGRFHWLTATRSSIIQTSPVHMGRCSDPAMSIERLFDRMVRV
ncbi:DUF3037 domain-containing protein [Novilysobacter erysipheiresistens]|uniref:DUF3037 domain-containing protein n=1 Tax=Novilysobacter erysipheiresistens TaxID=1749332 RepID=A0ABU7Z002_9GAMM